MKFPRPGPADSIIPVEQIDAFLVDTDEHDIVTVLGRFPIHGDNGIENFPVEIIERIPPGQSDHKDQNKDSKHQFLREKTALTG